MIKKNQQRNYEREKQIGMKRPKRVRKLNMRRDYEFKYLLGQIVMELPENMRGTIKGTVYSKASKIGIKEAKDYVLMKKEEGYLSEELVKKIVDLLCRYSKYV